MDFDLDDPLGSDDSFFEEPKALAKRSSITKSPEKKTLDSLLGLTTKSAENISKTEVEESIARPKSTVTFENTKSMDDWLLDAPKQLDKPKKTDFLEDILSIKPKNKPEKRGTSLEDILKESKANTGTKSTSLKDVNATEAQSDFSFTALPERRRGRRGSGVEDNLGLGLFSDEYQFGDFYSKDKKEVAPKSAETVQKPTPGEVPDWLGIGQTSKRAESPLKKTEKLASQPNVQTDEPTQTQIQISPANVTQKQISDLTPQKINTEIQNTYSSLHQQESLLLVSLQFKKYEDVLKEIQEKQHEILGKQENNFKNFVDEYIIKQQMVENNIRLQQERINQQIQMLLSETLNKKHSYIKTDEDNDTEETLKEQPHQNLVRKIKLRHDEELFLMEESYKKQMDFIEKSSTNSEENLRNELKNIATFFEEKINNLKANYEEETIYYKEKLKLMENQHTNDIKLLKEIHYQKLEELKAEHSAQIEYIKEMKQKENHLLNDGYVLSQKIDAGIEMLGSNVKVLQGIEEKVSQNYDILAVAREQSIQSKEKEIILMKDALKKCREAAENERAQLLSLVRNLELKLAEQNTNAQEDRWALQQATATLLARSKAIERESEYSRNIMEREKEQLKTLKESLLAEQEKIIMQLTEEKLLLATEKAKFQTSTKLTNTYEVERAKAEAETAIDEAKHLTERLNQERNLLQRQKTELQSLKHNLSERERELEDKEAELDFLMQDAQRKLKEDKQVLAEAKRMENIYKDRTKELQNQLVMISSREKKLREEKMLLSKERLNLYTSTKASKDCVLCSAGGESQFGKTAQITCYETNFNPKISDPNAVKIRLEAMDDEESEVSREGSNSNR